MNLVLKKKKKHESMNMMVDDIQLIWIYRA